MKLLDFGVAARLNADQQVAETVTVAMTPAYASPEQARNAPLTTASDVYSLGVVLFELLVGKRPPSSVEGGALPSIHELLFPKRGEAPSSTMRDASDRSTTPVGMRNELKGDIEAILRKALAPAPDDRYASVDAMLGDIRLHLKGRPVAAARATWRQRCRKFLKRNREAVSIIAVLSLAIIASIAYVSVQMDARRIAAENSLAQAQLLCVEGKWDEAQSLLVAAPQSTSEYHRQLIACHFAQDQFEACRDRIAVAREKFPQRAEFRVWELEFRIRRLAPPEPYQEILREALDGDLSPADTEFTRGLLAQAPLEAARHFRRAVALQPNHQRALQYLITTQTLLGDSESQELLKNALQLFPQSRCFHTLDALSNHPAASENWMDDLARPPGTAERVLIEQLSQLLASLPMPDASERLEFYGFIDDWLLAVRPKVDGLVESLDAVRASEGNLAFVIPPAFHRPLAASYQGLQAIFAEDFSQIDSLAPSLEHYPEPVTQYLLGIVLVVNATKRRGSEEYADDPNFPLAEAAFDRAANSNLLGRASRHASYGLALVQGLLAIDGPDVSRPEYRRKTIETTRKLLVTGDLPWRETMHLAVTVDACGDRELTRILYRNAYRKLQDDELKLEQLKLDETELDKARSFEKEFNERLQELADAFQSVDDQAGEIALRTKLQQRDIDVRANKDRIAGIRGQLMKQLEINAREETDAEGDSHKP